MEFTQIIKYPDIRNDRGFFLLMNFQYMLMELKYKKILHVQRGLSDRQISANIISEINKIYFKINLF